MASFSLDVEYKTDLKDTEYIYIYLILISGDNVKSVNFQYERSVFPLPVQKSFFSQNNLTAFIQSEF